MPSGHAVAAILLTVTMFYGFAAGKLKIEIISLSTISAIALGLYLVPLPGAQPADGLKLAFEGFGNYALITICALMIMGRGLVATGALDPAARALTRVWQLNRSLGLLVTLLLALTMSMMINDTPVLVLLLPIMASLAMRGGMPASKTLIPINSAVLIGGMATTIGTSTNLLVVSIATELGMKPMTVFHFTPIVLAAAAIALPFIWLVMPRLLPDNSSDAGHGQRMFVATLRFDMRSILLGRSASAVREALERHVTLLHLPERPLDPDDELEVLGTHEALEEVMLLAGTPALPIALADRLAADARARGEDLAYVELALTADSSLIGKLVSATSISDSHDVAVIGVHYGKQAWHDERSKDRDRTLIEGDILLVKGTMTSVSDLARAEGALMLDGAKDAPRTAKAPLALIIMGVSVGVASIGLLPIAISALAGAIAMFATGCVRFDKVGRALSAKVIVLVAASIAVGRIVLESGAAEWLSQLIAMGLSGLPAGLVLAAVMLFVTVLTNFASNTTAAAVGTPIAFSLAQKLSIPTEPLVLAVLFGCNLCYATPVAYQTNMLIMSAGDYRFADYTKTGLPLVVIMVTTLSALLAFQYGLL